MPETEEANMSELGVHYYVTPDKDQEQALLYCPKTGAIGQVMFEFATCKRGLCSLCQDCVKVNKD